MRNYDETNTELRKLYAETECGTYYILDCHYGLEAKVQELETEIHSLKHDPMTVANYNKIKLKGIDEMLDEISWHSDEYGLDYVYVFSINDHIAKLKESKDERKM